jgi:hypothetical protein
MVHHAHVQGPLLRETLFCVLEKMDLVNGQEGSKSVVHGPFLRETHDTASMQIFMKKYHYTIASNASI